MTTLQVLEADLTWNGRSFEPRVQVEIDEQGNVANVGALGANATERLSGRALLPGFVNAHSHAFQRGLRGRGERFPEGAGSFWTWREAMYALVDSLDEQRLYEWSLRAFQEMIRAGITTVGEFHYIHHDVSCHGFALDAPVLRAAEDAGIRLVLLYAYYRTGGIGRELEAGQRRFACRSVEAYWERFDQLASQLSGERQSLGVVVHSIRAAPLDDLNSMYEESQRRSLPFHMHVEEQPREIEECLEHYHKTPMAIINERLTVNPRFTAVHCTHTARADMDAFIQAGGNVCICPLTEANLGDGLADLEFVNRNGGRICLGTDSNARISMLEEMRWLEFGQRLRTQSRGMLRDSEGETASELLRAATIHGANSLGLRAGSIEHGHVADLIAIDLNHPELAGVDADTLAAAIVFGASDVVITDRWIGGRRIKD